MRILALHSWCMVGTQRANESPSGVALEPSGHICRAVVMECLVVARVRRAINITEVNVRIPGQGEKDSGRNVKTIPG